jgi:hypothetical protein
LLRYSGPRLVFKRFKFFGESFIKVRDETALSGAKPGNEVFGGPLASCFVLPGLADLSVNPSTAAAPAEL